MKRIGQILKPQQGLWPEDSRPPTASEIRRRGIPYDEEPPENTVCMFCGKVIEPVALVAGGRVMLWSNAEECGCDGYKAAEAKAEAERTEQERAAKMRRRARLLIEQSGIKKRFITRTFENFKRDTKGRQESYEAAKAYADNFADNKAQGLGLYIEGTNGTGKTHLAAAIALQLMAAGVPVIFKTSTDLLTDIKRTFDGGNMSEAEVLDIYKKIDLLIIDDLGKEQQTDWNITTLQSIFNDRYEDLMPVVITTNYNVKEIITALTPKGGDGKKAQALVSRLRGSSKILTMAWADARGAGL